MAVREIEVTVNEDGSISVEAVGFKDASCLDALKQLEELFGKASEVKLKPEARHKVKQTSSRKVKA